MPHLFVHCGLHKTGTTAIQRFMREHADVLARAGILYPTAGRPDRSGGHHNLAWELARDRRYEPRWGNLATLAQEIAHFDGDVVLSSEDFESLLSRPEGLHPLARLAAESGRELVAVVYLRNQAEYLESLYLQCLKAGVGDEYARFVREALELGEVSRREWTFLFDFAKGLDNLERLDGCEVRVRNYHALEGGSAISDFVATIGLPPDLFPAEAMLERHHEREPLLYMLAHFYHNRIGRRLTRPEQKAVLMLGQDLRAATPATAEARLADAFIVSNRRVCERFKVEEHGLVRTPPALPGASAADLAKVFSLETQLTIDSLAQLLAGPDPDARSRAQARAWRAWLVSG